MEKNHLRGLISHRSFERDVKRGILASENKRKVICNSPFDVTSETLMINKSMEMIQKACVCQVVHCRKILTIYITHLFIKKVFKFFSGTFNLTVFQFFSHSRQRNRLERKINIELALLITTFSTQSCITKVVYPVH